MASNPLIPATHRAVAQIPVRKTYTAAMAAASWVTRGSIFSDLSEDSVLKSCIPPIFNIGRTAIAMTIIPIPPIHCKTERQSKMPGGALSKLVIIVAPVVVRPLIASKKASV